MARLRYTATSESYVGEKVVVAATDFVRALKLRTEAGTSVVVALQTLLDEATWLEGHGCGATDRAGIGGLISRE